MESKYWFSKSDIQCACRCTLKSVDKKLSKLDKKFIRHELTKEKEIKRKRTLVNYEVVFKHFCPKVTPHLNYFKEVHSYVENVDWSFIGDINPVTSYPADLKNKIEFVYNLLKEYDQNTIIYYGIEKNPVHIDKYYHLHFLIKIDSAVNRKEIEDILYIASDPKNLKETRTYLKKYSNRYRNTGIKYTVKSREYGWGLLMNDKYINDLLHEN